MPLLTIRTNVPIDAERRGELTKKASALVAGQLGKSERYVMVLLQDDQALIFAGSADPCALLELKSIGLPEDRTAEISHALCSLVADETGIAADRVYIEFGNAQRHMWGWNSATF